MYINLNFMFMFDSLPWLPVLVSAILGNVLAMVWYSPGLFGKQWMEAVGLKDSDVEGDSMVGPMLISLVTSSVTLLTLSALISYGGAETFVEYLAITLLVWFGFFVMNDVGAVVWGKRKLSFLWVMGGYNLLFLLIATVILFFWQ